MPRFALTQPSIETYEPYAVAERNRLYLVRHRYGALRAILPLAWQYRGSLSSRNLVILKGATHG